VCCTHCCAVSERLKLRLGRNVSEAIRRIAPPRSAIRRANLTPGTLPQFAVTARRARSEVLRSGRSRSLQTRDQDRQSAVAPRNSTSIGKNCARPDPRRSDAVSQRGYKYWTIRPRRNEYTCIWAGGIAYLGRFIEYRLAIIVYSTYCNRVTGPPYLLSVEFRDRPASRSERIIPTLVGFS